MVELEQQCCRFLHFKVTENEKTIRLEVTGQPEVLAVIEDLFGMNLLLSVQFGVIRGSSCILRHMARFLILAFVVLWVAAPQVACFVPCNEASMPAGDCCKVVVQPDVATVVKVQRDVAPHFEFAASIASCELPSLTILNDGNEVPQEIHAPPQDPSASSLVLRI